MQRVFTFADLENWKARVPAGELPVRLGIFGQPVAHSLSPRMQNAGIGHCGFEMRYAPFEIAPEELEPALRLLPALGFVGVNLMIPHKTAAAQIVDDLDEFARAVGAVNTVRVDGEKLIGFNTDGPGFARAIRAEFGVALRDLRLLLFGAGGGAGRAIATKCALDRCQRLVLVNRTFAKAQTLAAELQFSFGSRRVEAIRWGDETLRAQLASIDLVVNATPLGMAPTDPPVLRTSFLAPHLMVYDTVYTPAPTPLIAAASEAGARGANGLSMLLHQGALAFERWFNREAPVAAMSAALTAAETLAS